MSAPSIHPNEIAKWSAPSTWFDGEQEFDLGPLVNHAASMQQAVLGKDGPTLDAASGVCLLIPIYIPAHKLGLLIHLHREADLDEESSDLIRQPFEKFTALRENPYVGFVSTKALSRKYARQITEGAELSRRLHRPHDFIPLRFALIKNEAHRRQEATSLR